MWTVSINQSADMATLSDRNNNRVTTVENDGTGITVPDDVLDIMFKEAKAKYRMGETRKALELVGMMAGEQIEVKRGTRTERQS